MELQAPLYNTHALFEAARYGNSEILDLLLQCEDVDVNQPAVSAVWVSFCRVAWWPEAVVADSHHTGAARVMFVLVLVIVVVVVPGAVCGRRTDIDGHHNPCGCGG
jgi:hypothetical protein